MYNIYIYIECTHIYIYIHDGIMTGLIPAINNPVVLFFLMERVKACQLFINSTNSVDGFRATRYHSNRIWHL